MENLFTNEWVDYFFVLAPITISILVAWVAFRQYLTSRDQLRLDLYNRRFAAFEAALTYYKLYFSTDADAEVKRKADVEFTCAYRKTSFLFGRESDVYKAFTELKDTLAARPGHQKQDPTTALQALEDALRPWLDFQKIR